MYFNTFKAAVHKFCLFVAIFVWNLQLFAKLSSLRGLCIGTAPQRDESNVLRCMCGCHQRLFAISHRTGVDIHCCYVLGRMFGGSSGMFFFFSLMCFYVFGFVRCLCCCFYLVHCADRGHLLPISRLLISVKIYANQRTQRRERGDASSRLMSFLMSPLPDPVAVWLAWYSNELCSGYIFENGICKEWGVFLFNLFLLFWWIDREKG